MKKKNSNTKTFTVRIQNLLYIHEDVIILQTLKLWKTNLHHNMNHEIWGPFKYNMVVWSFFQNYSMGQEYGLGQDLSLGWAPWAPTAYLKSPMTAHIYLMTDKAYVQTQCQAQAQNQTQAHA